MSKVKLKSYIKAYFKLRQTYQHSQNNEKSLHVYDASLIVKSELVVYTQHPCIYTKHCGHLIILRRKDKPRIPERPGGGGLNVLVTIFNDAGNSSAPTAITHRKMKNKN